MKLLLGLFLTLNLYADIQYDMYNFYKNKDYSKACDLGFSSLEKYKHNENYLSIYAFSCLNSDNINRLSIPIANLKHSKEARANATYFSVIQMQKKLLYHALIDNYDITNLELPTTEYVLSKVFDFYSKLEKDNTRKVYTFNDKYDKKLTYKLYMIQDGQVYKMVIEEFYDTIAIKRHLYW